jgi:hypothetical protein
MIRICSDMLAEGLPVSRNTFSPENFHACYREVGNTAKAPHSRGSIKLQRIYGNCAKEEVYRKI